VLAVPSRSAHDASIFPGAAKRRKRRIEPDLDLIKQVEQVTISALKGPAWRFAGIPSTGITDAVNVLVFPIWQLLPWLLFGCRNSQQRPSATYCEGAMLPAPAGGSRNGARWAAAPLLCQIR